MTSWCWQPPSFLLSPFPVWGKQIKRRWMWCGRSLNFTPWLHSEPCSFSFISPSSQCVAVSSRCVLWRTNAMRNKMLSRVLLAIEYFLNNMKLAKHRNVHGKSWRQLKTQMRMVVVIQIYYQIIWWESTQPTMGKLIAWQTNLPDLGVKMF